MKVSICLSTFNKPASLKRTIASIIRQTPPFDFEVIIVDDGSDQPLPPIVDPRITVIRIPREPIYRNPSVARNLAYKRAIGEIVIAQSDDVIHKHENTIETLVGLLLPGVFVIATVVNVDSIGKVYCDPSGKGYGDRLAVYTSPTRRRPLFFLGALYRSDIYAVGGNDEEFIAPSGEDMWFADCLTQGLKLKPVYTDKVVGYHQTHNHCNPSLVGPSQALLKQRRKVGIWTSHKGPWPYRDSPNP